MRNGVLYSILKAIVLSTYMLTMVLLIPSPQCGTFDTQSSCRDMDSALELLIEDLLGLENELANWSVSGLDDGADIMEVHQPIRFNALSEIIRKQQVFQTIDGSISAALEFTYDSYKPELNTPPPQV